MSLLSFKNSVQQLKLFKYLWSLLSSFCAYLISPHLSGQTDYTYLNFLLHTLLAPFPAASPLSSSLSLFYGVGLLQTFVYSCFVPISVTETSYSTSAAPAASKKPAWQAGVETIGLTLGTVFRGPAFVASTFSFSQVSPALESTALPSVPGPSLCCFYLQHFWHQTCRIFFFPTKSTNSPTLQTLPRCPITQFSSDSRVSTAPTGEGFSPTRLPPTLDASPKS